MEKMLEKIDMTRGDHQVRFIDFVIVHSAKKASNRKVFQRYMENIRREVRELRVILESVEAKNKERVWLKNQTSGDLDDTKM